MATQKSNSVLGDFTGSVGTVTLTKWMDLAVMKSRIGARHKKTTSVPLIRQNNVFGMVSHFFSSARELIRMGYQRPKVAKMTPFNAMASYHLKNAIIGDPDNPVISLSKIKLTFPIRKTQSVWNPVLSLEAGNNVIVNWETNPFPHKCTQLDDKVILVYYNKNGGSFNFIREDIDRSHLSHSCRFGAGYNNHEIYWYMFLISADGKLVSETEYLGMVTLSS